MIKNYLMVALRQLKKQKMYSAIKIGGFALSIAACILIALFVRHELSYDQFYPNTANIYRLVGQIQKDGLIQKAITFPAPAGKILKSEFPEVEKSGRLMPNPLFDGAGSNQLMRDGNPQITFEEGFTWADQEMIDILQLPMAKGDAAHALDKPNTLVISERMAEKYFPKEDPIGKVFYLNNDRSKPYTISAVMENIPKNSHLQTYDFWLSLSGKEFYPGEQTNWLSYNYIDYIQLRPNTDVNAFSKKLSSVLLTKYIVLAIEKAGLKNAQALTASASMSLQPIGDVYLKSYDIKDYASVSKGDIRFVWLFGAIAAFILIVACINFVNLATAKSANRAKEVGLRMAVGSQRGGLILQFLLESLLYSFLSLFLGVLMAWQLLPMFNTLANQSLVFPWSEWWLLPALLGSATLLGVVAGIYPALYLSSFKPQNVLKGSLSLGSKNAIFRNTLVVFQFVTSIVLIIGTMVVYSQMRFILTKKLGFDKGQIVLIQGADALGNQVSAFKQELKKSPFVKNVSVGDYVPVEVTGGKRNGNAFWKEGKVNVDVSVPGEIWLVDEDYLPTYGMKIVAGRNFSKAMPTDSSAVIINQAMAKKLGLANPIGKRITNGTLFTVIGVVEDFNYESLKEEVRPIALSLRNSPSIISVKTSAGDPTQAIKAINASWSSFVRNQPLRYTFLDQSYAKMYADVQRIGNVFTAFAILTIVIACLGLFGLAAFMAEQRTKEIGIRKVLGASVMQVTTLLSKSFLGLVLVAIVIATPLAWYAMDKWLQGFVYRIDIGWWVFALAGALALLIAFATVSFQSIKAALANPVKSLRSE